MKPKTIEELQTLVMGCDEIIKRYPRLIVAMQTAALLSLYEAASAIQSIQLARATETQPFGCEAVQHYGGCEAVIKAAANQWTRQRAREHRAWVVQQQHREAMDNRLTAILGE